MRYYMITTLLSPQSDNIAVKHNEVVGYQNGG